MIGFTETAYIPEYTQLAAIVGRGKLKADMWPEWSRLQDKFGWKILLKAADRCEPDKRWSGNVEAICMQLKKDEDEAAQLRSAPPPRPSNPAARAAQFQDIRTKYGV
jgi:hypothetical protein